MSEQLFTRKDAAQFLGISTGTLDSARKNGKISFIQYVPNGNVYFTQANLQEFLAKSTCRALQTDKARLTYRKSRDYRQ